MKDTDKFDYKGSVAEIDAILEKIENGEPDIDELSSLVRRAAYLVKECRSKLRDTEEDIEKTLNDLED